MLIRSTIVALAHNGTIICVRWGFKPLSIIKKTKLKDMQKNNLKNENPTDVNNVLADSGFVSRSCKGEVCSVCGKPATNKLEETIFWDDPNKLRHPLTAYVCREHFRMIVGG